jgi:hypothetical protein
MAWIVVPFVAPVRSGGQTPAELLVELGEEPRHVIQRELRQDARSRLSLEKEAHRFLDEPFAIDKGVITMSVIAGRNTLPDGDDQEQVRSVASPR